MYASDRPWNATRSMHSERALQALLTIKDNIVLARTWAGSMSFHTFAEERQTFYAVTRCLEIISEASRRLPDDLRERHPSMPWRDSPMRETPIAMPMMASRNASSWLPSKGPCPSLNGSWTRNWLGDARRSSTHLWRSADEIGRAHV